MILTFKVRKKRVVCSILLIVFFFLKVGNPAHPQLRDVVYLDKHVQPSDDTCMGSVLTKFHGAIDARALVQGEEPTFLFLSVNPFSVASLQQTGDTHAAVYDFKNMKMLVSNASPYVNGSVVAAYDRPFIQLDMQALFSLQE
jgi:hypothetical protein